MSIFNPTRKTEIKDNPSNIDIPDNSQVIIFGGGCFWCFDATFKLVKGIIEVEMGYSGGTIPNPTDEDIYYKNSGHAEVVKLTYNPDIISIDDILEIYWSLHDPTTIDRQGVDVGSQYRSIVFYKDEKQKEIIEKAKIAAQKNWDDPIVTEIKKFEIFYPADEHHKYYETNRPDYCQIVINPKLAKLRKKFAAKLIE